MFRFARRLGYVALPVTPAPLPVAAVVTYAPNIEAGLGFDLVGGLAFPAVDAAAYCGSFVGMAFASVLPSAGYAAFAGFDSRLVFVTGAAVEDAGAG